MNIQTKESLKIEPIKIYKKDSNYETLKKSSNAKMMNVGTE